jgi:hypothetical protein
MKPLYVLFAAASCLAVVSAKAQNATSGSSDNGDGQRSLFGVKAGYNIAKVKGSTPSFSPRNNNGFLIGVFFSPASRGVGYRNELIFSRQGFTFDADGNKQEVTQDYLYMPHFSTFTIADRVQFQAGIQFGYLLNAKKTSSDGTESDIKEYMKRLDYGFAGGVEIYPFKGLLLGARYNISLGNIYEQYETGGTTPTPVGYPFPFNPDNVKGKNAVVQFFAGYRF